MDGLSSAYEKNLYCPSCHCDKIIRKGIRRRKIKYLCKSCHKYFQINRGSRIQNKNLLGDHLSGISFRSLGDKYQINASTAYRRCLKELGDLPHCADITRKYCDKFCGILLVDGKYLAVKGYERKIPVLYGIDYLTHDIPTYLFSVGENYQTCQKFFTALRLLNYPLRAVVSDDNMNIYQACLTVYPRAVTQLCQNHYKQNIRWQLNTRTDPTYQPFMKEVEELFSFKRSQDDFSHFAGKIYDKYQSNIACRNVLINIQQRFPQLTGYLSSPGLPVTTNLIESYNSHLEGRLKTIKGFESFNHADTWLNGFFIRRRLKNFTDCTGKFKKLNGKCSLELSLKENYQITDVLRLVR